MNKHLYALLIAQFLSAFADNAVLFILITLATHSHLSTWYVPALQSMFLIAPILLAPWVGGFADQRPKAQVLMIANLVKASGVGLLLLHVEPLLAYALVGAGAAIYAPAKYGILPELAGHTFLVRANSWIEGSTIAAILLGPIVGAKIADYSIPYALLGALILFISSAIVTLFLPMKVLQTNPHKMLLREFPRRIYQFLSSPRSRFVVLGTSLFWATAACLRVIIIAWAPLVLLTKNTTEIAQLSWFLSIGIIVGAAVTPFVIRLENLRLARIPAYCMGLFIIGLSFTHAVLPAGAVLFAIGTAGGMFIVPVNAALQEIGQHSIGSGAAVALQNFFESSSMLLAVGIYTAYTALLPLNLILVLLILGCCVCGLTFVIAQNLDHEKNIKIS